MPRTHGFTWTAEIIDRLKNLVAEGKMSKEIAPIISREVGRTISVSKLDNVRHFYKIRKPRLGANMEKNPEGIGLVSLDKIKEKFDIKATIMRELAKVPKGRLIIESEFAQKCAGYDRVRFRRCLENNEEEFRQFRVKLRLDEGDAKTYWGNAEDILAAIKMRDQ